MRVRIRVDERHDWPAPPRLQCSRGSATRGTRCAWSGEMRIVDHFHPFRVSIFQRLTADSLSHLPFALMGCFGASIPTGRMKCVQEVSFTSFTIICHVGGVCRSVGGSGGVRTLLGAVRTAPGLRGWQDGRMAGWQPARRRASRLSPRLMKKHVIASLPEGGDGDGCRSAAVGSASPCIRVPRSCLSMEQRQKS